jgi:thiosulfate/3-mercaptopyruvate sulfurtransferase
VEHIPGAVYLNENHFRAYHFNLPTNYSPPESIQHILRHAGIHQNKPVIIYGGHGKFSKIGDGLEQTMVAYSLARFGHPQIYLLNGGLDSYTNNYKKEKEYPQVTESDFYISIQSEIYLTYKQFIEYKDIPGVTLIDVRPRSVYEGISLWSKPGHIPGAVNLPWRLLMQHDNPRMLRDEPALLEMIHSKGITPDKSLVVYCGTGREATAAFLYYKYHLKYPNVKIFEGSFTEWCSYPQNKTVTGPHPF